MMRIAFHEAGHAVAQWRFGFTVERVTIRPTEDNLGCSQAATWDGRAIFSLLDGMGEPPTSLLRASVIVAFAGPVAERLGMGRSPSEAWTAEEEEMWASDKVSAADCLLRLTAKVEERARELWVETEGEIRTLWPSVVRVADALLLRGELAGVEVLELLQSHHTS